MDEEIKSLRRTETDLRRAIAAHRRCAMGGDLESSADEHEDLYESNNIFFPTCLNNLKKDEHINISIKTLISCGLFFVALVIFHFPFPHAGMWFGI